jgi:ADP-heptose:LPS heptosyltransferase
MHTEVSTPKRILVYRIGSLGDTIIALPVFHKVLEAFPGADITLLTNRPILSKAAPLESVLGTGHFFHRVINYPTGTRDLRVLLNLVAEIRKLKIEVVVNLTTTRILRSLHLTKFSVFRDKVFFRAAGITQFVGFPREKADYLLTVDAATGEFEWEAKRLARRVASLGAIQLEADRYWDLCFTKDEMEQADQFLDQLVPGQPVLAICAGTKRQPNDWEEENWLALMRQFSIQLPGWQLVIVGAADEFDRAANCLAAWQGDGINLCGKTAPRISGAILKKAALFIGHDSGPMHLAAATGTPCVAIFSARNFPRQWYPRGDFNTIIYHRTDCAGCLLEMCVEQQKKCIISITVSEVISAVMATLEKNKMVNNL